MIIAVFLINNIQKLQMIKIDISDSCEPYMYNTYNSLLRVQIGDVITLKFGNKPFRVKKEYLGKTVKFIVNNFIKHNYRRPTKRLALIPFDKVDSYKKKDILFLDDADRFECLMIDLFSCNKRPYAGWKNKTVEIIKIKRN